MVPRRVFEQEQTPSATHRQPMGSHAPGGAKSDPWIDDDLANELNHPIVRCGNLAVKVTKPGPNTSASGNRNNRRADDSAILQLCLDQDAEFFGERVVCVQFDAAITVRQRGLEQTQIRQRLGSKGVRKPVIRRQSDESLCRFFHRRPVGQT